MNIDVNSFRNSRILVVGDIMIDEYIWGKVERISPEAPVQIIEAHDEDYTLGGSGNVVNNLVALGASVSTVGIIGAGSNGLRLVRKLEQLGVDPSGLIRDLTRPTIRKTRVIAANQHVLRIDWEKRGNISDESFDTALKYIEAVIPETDIAIVSDYGKGLITKALLTSVLALGDKHGIKVLVDPKGFDYSKYSGAALLTPNKKEASLASGVDITDLKTLSAAAEKIFSLSGIEHLLITCGEDGMTFFDQDKTSFQIEARARQVYDVSGAGDTVISVFALALASGASYKDAAVLANIAAGIVVAKVGTATVSPQELITELTAGTEISRGKHKTIREMADLSAELKKAGKRIVMTNGCFDILHAGHIELFTESKKLGDVLILAIDDDASVMRIKGKGRPVLNAQERIRVLSALDTTDYIVTFSTDALSDLITLIKPDILTKGSNYTPEKVYGADDVASYGGKIKLIPVTNKFSASSIISNIKKS